MTEFNKLYGQLNKAQKEAVDTIEGPVMVIAGPGTGKTQILTLRIANILLKTDTPPGGILALTFTEAGAKEMKRRLREIIGPQANDVRIHTYHGFANSIIVEFDDHFPHLGRIKQITEIEAEMLVRDILKEKRFAKLRPFGEPDFYVDKIIGTISDAKKEAWTPEMVRVFATDEIKRIEEDEKSMSSRGPTKGKLRAEALKRIEKCERTILFADVYKAYEQSKKDQRKMDYDDLIVELLLAFRTDELLLKMIQERFLYILVDEHQDTNDSQNVLIRMIADFFETPNLFVVGDEKQAIYRFQGASVENFLRFQNIWKSMRVIPLETNYRSHQSILDASFSMIEHNYAIGEHDNLRIPLHSDTDETPCPIDLIMAGNMVAGDTYLANEIRTILNKYPTKTIAIITRRNREIEHLLRLCERCDIPASAERGIDIFSHPLGTLFFALIEFLADPSAIEALAKTIAGGLWNLNFETQIRLIRAIRAGTVSEIDKEITAIAILKKEATQIGAIAYLTLAGELSGINALASRDPLSAEVWRAIILLASELAGRGSTDDPIKLINDLLAYRASADKKSIKISTGVSNAQVRIMTAHGSKGLEFDYVFVPYATEESWIIHGRGAYFILPREKEEGDEIRDIRRLFYVALTRARSHVCIISPYEESPDQPLTPLRFLDEIPSRYISRIDLPAQALTSVKAQSIETIGSHRAMEMIEYAKRSLREHGLSVTALNHFCECPNKFLFKSILKLPEPPSANAERGNAIHEAMARVWHLTDKSESTITATIKKIVHEYFRDSLLPIFEKEPVIEELIVDAPIVAAALKTHISQTGTIATEMWVEQLLETAYGKEVVSLNLHGKLDAVLDTKSAVFVFDYKTREALSINAIKGETKNSNRDYFRQLVFYKILLEKNQKYKNKSIEPALVFIKPDSKNRCPIISLPVEPADIKQVKQEIKDLIESVWSGKFLTTTCDDKDCEYCALRKMME
ncbi:MAG: ATP-dependent DNA helicase [Patescibacteria group bacterium]